MRALQVLRPPARALALSRLSHQRLLLVGRLATPSLAAAGNGGHRHSSSSSSSETGGRQTRNHWFLVFPAVCFGLGTWQVYRRRWKLGLIETLSGRTGQPPVVVAPGASVAGLLPRLPELEYRPVTLTGEFDHAAETLIGPRHFIDPAERDSSGGGGGGGNSGLFSSGAGVGYHVVTPLQLDREQRVLVNRGWVPARLADPATRPQGQTAGQVTVTGLVRLTEPAGSWLLGGKNTASVGRRGGGGGGGSSRQVTCHLRRDVESLSSELGTVPMFLDAVAAAVPGGGGGGGASGCPIGGQTRLSLRNEHLSYIFTWYSLGSLLVLLWALKIR